MDDFAYLKKSTVMVSVVQFATLALSDTVVNLWVGLKFRWTSMIRNFGGHRFSTVIVMQNMSSFTLFF